MYFTKRVPNDRHRTGLSNNHYHVIFWDILYKGPVFIYVCVCV